MRGLTGAGPSRARSSSQAVIAATAVFAALALFAAACGTGGTGARDEGPAHASAVAGAVASPSPSPTETYRHVDAVALLRRDPAVSTAVKRELKPCSGEDEYPVQVTYGDLTGGPVNDVLVNVLSCSDQVGIGAYVYRDENGTYTNVFESEESPVFAEIDGAELTVTMQVYATDDQMSNPSTENVITYDWSARAGHFVQRHAHRTDYSKAGLSTVPAPDN
ncbi:hypothetical protein [Streptomyces sp. NK08204]|uniref:hypothetical protein n=1 Tax=Streptomyces sp. NK08204 TaxID=2873260 RepID=UPI001CEC2653|nr:hypothetical protein [Streptomyces sp. NK08204]